MKLRNVLNEMAKSIDDYTYNELKDLVDQSMDVNYRYPNSTKHIRGLKAEKILIDLGFYDKNGNVVDSLKHKFFKKLKSYIAQNYT